MSPDDYFQGYGSALYASVAIEVDTTEIPFADEDPVDTDPGEGDTDETDDTDGMSCTECSCTTPL
jgi:hypothetical protein